MYCFFVIGYVRFCMFGCVWSLTNCCEEVVRVEVSVFTFYNYCSVADTFSFDQVFPMNFEYVLCRGLYRLVSVTRIIFYYIYLFLYWIFCPFFMLCWLCRFRPNWPIGNWRQFANWPGRKIGRLGRPIWRPILFGQLADWPPILLWQPGVDLSCLLALSFISFNQVISNNLKFGIWLLYLHRRRLRHVFRCLHLSAGFLRRSFVIRDFIII